MQNRHKHADLIIAWANGTEMQYFCELNNEWSDISNPSWDHYLKYRIKPKEDEYKVFRDALKEGKEIQIFQEGYKQWKDISNPSFSSPPESYRIKPEPKYVPFTWEDREQLRGKWIKNKISGEECIVTQLGKIIKPGVLSYVVKLTETWTSLSIIFDNYTFLDGSTCGKLVNE